MGLFFLHCLIVVLFSDEVDSRWTRLINTLAGQFCASFNQLGRTSATIPRWSFRPLGSVDSSFYGLESAESRISNSSQKTGRLLGDDIEVPGFGKGASASWTEAFDWLVSPRASRPEYHRYGVLPAEAVCTENLTPFRKLLPCTRSVRCRCVNLQLELYNTDSTNRGSIYICMYCTYISIGRTLLSVERSGSAQHGVSLDRCTRSARVCSTHSLPSLLHSIFRLFIAIYSCNPSACTTVIGEFFGRNRRKSARRVSSSCA